MYIYMHILICICIRNFSLSVRPGVFRKAFLLIWKSYKSLRFHKIIFIASTIFNVFAWPASTAHRGALH